MMANKEVSRRRGRWREHEKPCSVISVQLWNIRYGTFRTFMLICVLLLSPERGW